MVTVKIGEGWPSTRGDGDLRDPPKALDEDAVPRP